MILFDIPDKNYCQALFGESVKRDKPLQNGENMKGKNLPGEISRLTIIILKKICSALKTSPEQKDETLPLIHGVFWDSRVSLVLIFAVRICYLLRVMDEFKVE